MLDKNYTRRYLVKFRGSDDSSHSFKGRRVFSLPRPRQEVSINGNDFSFRLHLINTVFAYVSSVIRDIEPSAYDTNFRYGGLTYDNSVKAFCAGHLFSINFDYDFSYVDCDRCIDSVAAGSGVLSFFDVTGD